MTTASDGWLAWFNYFAAGAEEDEPVAWHSLTVEKAAVLLATSPEGLEEAEARRRRVACGRNEIPVAPHQPPAAWLGEQVRAARLLLVLAAAGVVGLLGSPAAGIGVAGLAVFQLLLARRRQRLNHRWIEAWRRRPVPVARIVRPGLRGTIPATDLAPGDVIELKTGDDVPADARLVEAHGLICSRLMPYGETWELVKKAAPTDPAQSSHPEPASMVYVGTSVVCGDGLAIVTAIGRATRLAGRAGVAEDDAD